MNIRNTLTRWTGVLCICLPWVALSGATLPPSLSSSYTFVTLDYPGAVATFPLGINMNREIAGFYVDSTFTPHAFLYKSCKFTNTDFPKSSGAVTGGINDRGDIAGVYSDERRRGSALRGHSWTC